MSLLSIDNASYYFRTSERPVFDNLKISFEAGKMYFILSEDALEKKILFSLLSGLDFFTKGFLKFNGKIIHKDTIDQYRKNEVGIYLREYNFLNDRSPLANLFIYLRVTDPKVTRESCLNRLAKVGINREQAMISMSKLDLLTQKRYGLAKALARNPKILLASDLFTDIDEPTEEMFFSYLKKQMEKEHLCVILSSNHPKIIRHGDEVWGLNQGKLLFIQEKTMESRDL